MKYSLMIGTLLNTLLFANDHCCSPEQLSPCDLKNTSGDMTLPSARDCIQRNCSRPSFGGGFDLSFLVWQAHEDGLEFALKNHSRLAPSPNLLADVNGSMKTIHFDWKPAFKCNFEMAFPNTWDLDMQWTFFYSRSAASSHADTSSITGSGLYPLWVLPQSYQATFNCFGKARGIWHVHLNTANIVLGYHPFLTPKFSLHLQCGLKGISISQQYSAQYSDGINDGSVTLLTSKAALRNRCLGLGPYFGIKAKWHLNKGWSLLANVAPSFSLCAFNIKRNDADHAIANDGTIYDEQSKFKESFYVYRPNIEGLLGFGWNDCIGCRKQFSIDFSAAYEVQYYFSQNMMRQLASEPISFSPFSMNGDLYFHGLTATFRFGY